MGMRDWLGLRGGICDKQGTGHLERQNKIGRSEDRSSAELTVEKVTLSVACLEPHFAELVKY